MVVARNYEEEKLPETPSLQPLPLSIPISGGMLSEADQVYSAARELENTSRGPNFGDFVTIHTEASMQGVTVARLQSTRVHNPLFPSLLNNVQYCVKLSLWTVKIFLAQH
jgi:hypothetical protein